jgi:hypothetical protein
VRGISTAVSLVASLGEQQFPHHFAP